MEKQKTLTAQTILEAQKIFFDQGWSLDEDSTFDRFCESLKFFSDDEKLLLLELTKKFLYLDVSKYQRGILEVFYQIGDEELESKTKIYIHPLLKQEDINKNKSSHMVYYLFNNYRHHLPDNLNNKITFIDKPGVALKKLDTFNADRRFLIVLVDDFIGSGDTALDAVNYLSQEKGFRKDNIVVITLVAQQKGIDYLKSNGVNCFSHIVRDKGITDNYSDDLLIEKIRLMDSIESRLNIREDRCFGYGRSEALVRVVNTPNNTFPVYWHETKSIKYKAVFPRKKK